jgi:histidyl-tRNA synthetase
MVEPLQAIRGMSDLLPEQATPWVHVEQALKDVLAAYAYNEIRVPIVERTELFRRSIGEVTDIVEKEMYSFDDRNGVSLTLRPEATAGIVRAAIEHGLVRNQRHKLWCMGPMFRYEKPQKGRYRQFHQFDIEALGYEGPDIDAELLLMTGRIWRVLGIRHITLQINSLGTAEARAIYRRTLADYFRAHLKQLDEDSQRRLDRNPMRILDSKNPEMATLVAGAPLLSEHLDPASAEHFASLRATLDSAGVSYAVNPRLVRGLDYYNRTVFEWVTDRLGTQGAVCAGGRYDGLVSELGGPATPAIGCAIGLERLVELYSLAGAEGTKLDPQVFVVAAGEGTMAVALQTAEALRDVRPGTRIELNMGGGSFKTQMRRADQSGALFAVIIGENELQAGTVAVKALREERPQSAVASSDAAQYVAKLLSARA